MPDRYESLEAKSARLRALRLAAEAAGTKPTLPRSGKSKSKPASDTDEAEIEVEAYKGYPALDMESELPFGKHKGATVQSVIKHDPLWLQWALDNIKSLSVSHEVEAALDLELYRRKRRSNHNHGRT